MVSCLCLRLQLIVYLWAATIVQARLLMSNGAAVQCDGYHLCPPGYECMFSDLFAGVKACYSDVKERGNRPGRCPTLENPLQQQPGSMLRNPSTNSFSASSTAGQYRPRNDVWQTTSNNPYRTIGQGDPELGNIYAPLSASAVSNQLPTNNDLNGPYNNLGSSGGPRQKRQWPPVVNGAPYLQPQLRFPMLQDSPNPFMPYRPGMVFNNNQGPFGGAFQTPPGLACGPMACAFDGDCPPMQKCCYSGSACTTRTCIAAVPVDTQPTVAVLLEGGMDSNAGFIFRNPRRNVEEYPRGTVALVQTGGKNILWDTGSPQQRLDLIAALRDLAGLSLGDLNYLFVSSGLPQYSSNAGLFSDIPNNVNAFTEGFLLQNQYNGGTMGGMGQNMGQMVPGATVDGRGNIIDGRGNVIDGRGNMIDGRGNILPSSGARPETVQAGDVPVSTSPALNSPIGLGNLVPPQNRTYIDGDHNLELVSIPGLYAALIVYNAKNLGTVALVGDMLANEYDFVNNDKYRLLTQSNYWSQMHLENRRRIFCKADFVVPGQGKMFRVTEEQRRTVGGC